MIGGLTRSASTRSKGCGSDGLPVAGFIVATGRFTQPVRAALARRRPDQLAAGCLGNPPRSDKSAIGSAMDSAELLSPSDLATAQPAKIVYLDQNKWIDLARAVAAPEGHPEDRTLLEFLCAKVEAGQIRLPLTASNLYETHKLNDPAQRFNLAYTQVTLSGAEVFRGHRRRLETEAALVLSKLYKIEWTEQDPDWVFSTLFLEAHMDADDPRLETPIPERVLARRRAYPQKAMLDHLAGGPDDVRRAAISKFESGCEALRVDIEARRIRHRSENESMRRKIY